MSASITSLIKDGSEYANPSARRETFTIPLLSVDFDLVLLEDLAGDGLAEAPARGVPVIVTGRTTKGSATLDFAVDGHPLL